VGFGPGSVDGLDAGVGVGAAQDFAVYQPSELDVGTILSTTGDLVDTVWPYRSCTNDAILDFRED
jgi:hypothetical protein